MNTGTIIYFIVVIGVIKLISIIIFVFYLYKAFYRNNKATVYKYYEV